MVSMRSDTASGRALPGQVIAPDRSLWVSGYYVDIHALSTFEYTFEYTRSKKAPTPVAF